MEKSWIGNMRGMSHSFAFLGSSWDEEACWLCRPVFSSGCQEIQTCRHHFFCGSFCSHNIQLKLRMTSWRDSATGREFHADQMRKGMVWERSFVATAHEENWRAACGRKRVCRCISMLQAWKGFLQKGDYAHGDRSMWWQRHLLFSGWTPAQQVQTSHESEMSTLD